MEESKLILTFINDMTLLPVIAEEVGLDRARFESCLDSGKYAEVVQEQFDDAVAAGARGTPHSIMIVGDQFVAIPGAQPYASVRSAIEAALSDGRTDDPTHQAVPVI